MAMTEVVAADTATHAPAEAPPWQVRLAAAVMIGVAAAWLTYMVRAASPNHPGDVAQVWFAARAMWHGQNPYTLVGPGRAFEWAWPLYYPLTAMVTLLPLAALPEIVARCVFVGGSAALLAYMVSRGGSYRWLMFLSVPFINAAGLAQWTPLLTAAYCVPMLGWLFAAKPNIGLALTAALPSTRTTRMAVLGGLVLLVVSVVLQPTWPGDWLHAISGASHIRPPVMRVGGVLVLLAAARWRRPEARLLLALALVPQTGVWYDDLPLLLIPRSGREMLVLVALSGIGRVAQQVSFAAFPVQGYLAFSQRVSLITVLTLFLPCAVMVLRRPNEGEVPAWLEWVATGVRAGLRCVGLPRRAVGDSND